MPNLDSNTAIDLNTRLEELRKQFSEATAVYEKALIQNKPAETLGELKDTVNFLKRKIALFSQAVGKRS